MFDVNVMQRPRSNLIICFVIRELGLVSSGNILDLANLLHKLRRVFIIVSAFFFWLMGFKFRMVSILFRCGSTNVWAAASRRL